MKSSSSSKSVLTKHTCSPLLKHTKTHMQAASLTLVIHSDFVEGTDEIGNATHEPEEGTHGKRGPKYRAKEGMIRSEDKIVKTETLSEKYTQKQEDAPA